MQVIFREIEKEEEDDYDDEDGEVEICWKVATWHDTLE